MTHCYVLSAIHLRGDGRVEAGEEVELADEDFSRFLALGCVEPLAVRKARLDAEAEIARLREAAEALAAEQLAEIEAKAKATVDDVKAKADAETAEIEKAASERDGPRSRRRARATE